MKRFDPVIRTAPHPSLHKPYPPPPLRPTHHSHPPRTHTHTHTHTHNSVVHLFTFYALLTIFKQQQLNNGQVQTRRIKLNSEPYPHPSLIKFTCRDASNKRCQGCRQLVRGAAAEARYLSLWNIRFFLFQRYNRITNEIVTSQREWPCSV